MVKIENLTINVGEKHLYTIKELTFGSGELINIAGNNSTGKTIFIEALQGEFSDYLGEITIKESSPIFSRKKRETLALEIIPHLLENESIWKNLVLPLPKITPRIKQKITELCSKAGFNEKISHKCSNLSYSEKKFVELIRVTIQLPKLVLIDDFDIFFDAANQIKAMEILNYAKKSGTTIITTSKNRLEGFDKNFRINGMKLGTI